MPRQDEQDLFFALLNQGRTNADKLAGSQSKFAGVNSLQDVQSRFGVGGDTSGIYNPLRRNLASARGGALSRASARAGGSATPEGSLFSPIENQYQQGENQLASEQGRSDIAQGNYAAQLLQGSMGAQDQYGLQQAGLEGSLLGGMQGQITQHRASDFNQRDPSFWAKATSILEPAAEVAGAALTGGATIPASIAGRVAKKKPAVDSWDQSADEQDQFAKAMSLAWLP